MKLPGLIFAMAGLVLAASIGLLIAAHVGGLSLGASANEHRRYLRLLWAGTLAQVAIIAAAVLFLF